MVSLFLLLQNRVLVHSGGRRNSLRPHWLSGAYDARNLDRRVRKAERGRDAFRVALQKGDCIFIPGGVPHAIGGRGLLLETQEPSDLLVVPVRFTPAGANRTNASCTEALVLNGYSEEWYSDRYIIEDDGIYIECCPRPL